MSKDEKSPFDFIDMSAKKAWPEKVWKEKCRDKICLCDGLIVLLSKYTGQASGVRWEIKCAREEKIHVVGIHIKKNEPGAIPPELPVNKVMSWSWEDLERFINKL